MIEFQTLTTIDECNKMLELLSKHRMECLNELHEGTIVPKLIARYIMELDELIDKISRLYEECSLYNYFSLEHALEHVYVRLINKHLDTFASLHHKGTTHHTENGLDECEYKQIDMPSAIATENYVDYDMQCNQDVDSWVGGEHIVGSSVKQGKKYIISDLEPIWSGWENTPIDYSSDKINEQVLVFKSEQRVENERLFSIVHKILWFTTAMIISLSVCGFSILSNFILLHGFEGYIVIGTLSTIIAFFVTKKLSPKIKSFIREE